jgi:hypothetical protein
MGYSARWAWEEESEERPVGSTLTDADTAQGDDTDESPQHYTNNEIAEAMTTGAVTAGMACQLHAEERSWCVRLASTR